MKILSDKIDSTNLHHGYLIVGEREMSRQSLFDFLEQELNVVTVANPDFSFFDFNTLSIDEARDLATMQERRGFENEAGSSKKFFVVSTNIITDEAQNALLKVFEEPTVGTHFFILASQNTFLPTFLSRLVVIQTTDTQEASNILKQSLPERLAIVTKLAGDISDEKKVKQDAIALVNQIESELFENGVENNVHALRECQFARNALFSRGAMVKMILENLMLQI
jgi:DNA polymerase III delta prime subunit